MSRRGLTARVTVIAGAAAWLLAVLGPAASATSARPAAGAARTSPAVASGVAVSPQRAGLDEMMLSYGSNNLIGTSWWQAAIAQSTLETYQQDTGDTTYYSDIAQTYSTYVGDDPQGQPAFEDSYLDDTGWWGLAWLQFYTMTGDASYLQTAETDASYVHQQWDTNASSCGGVGGVYWEITSSGDIGRVSISNEVFLELTAWLYNVTKNSTYLSWAQAEWAWLSGSGLITSSNLVYDGFNGNCQQSGTYWSYNQGVILAGLAQLYVATGNASLLTKAEDIATAAIGKLAPSGVLKDSCEPSGCGNDGVSFKGIFVRDLRMMATIAGTTQFNSFLAAQAAAVEAHDTNGNNQLGLSWSGPAPSPCPAAVTSTQPCNSQTQVSAEDALVAALGPTEARPAAVANPNGTVRVFALAAGGGLTGGSLEQDSLASGSSAWSGFTSLGGATPYGPSAVAASNGDTWVFVIGANGVLYADRLPSGSATWSGWSSAGSPSGTHLAGVGTVVQDHTGVIRVFARGVNGSLYTDSLSGTTWSGFTNLGGVWPYDVAALVGKGGYVHVFAVGTTGNLYHDQMLPGSSWSGWSDLGGQVTGIPAVTQDSGGTIRAYARQTPAGGLLEYYSATGSSYPTDTHGGAWPYDDVAVADTGTYSVSVFGVGTTGSAYWQYLTPTPTWSGWTNLGGSFTGVPATLTLSDGAIDLFADSAGSLQVRQESGGTWSAWTSLGGSVS